MMACQEVKTTKKRQFGGIGKSKEAGKWGSRPRIGYLKGKEAGMLLIDEKKAKGIREVFLNLLKKK